jgi:hypothetical protein
MEKYPRMAMGRHTRGRITINNFEKMENLNVICYKNGIAHGNPFSPEA